MQDLRSQQQKRYGIFRDQLNIEAFRENHKAFKNEENRKRILGKSSHFIILHLSFLETIWKEGTQIPYKENEVELFFENEIENYYTRYYGSPIPPNVILVIVSGRGRGDWFTATEHPQITFRPIEAILNAIEDGLSLNDDFQVKYNLCNVLFGS